MCLYLTTFISWSRLTFYTLITFLTVENNNLNIQYRPMNKEWVMYILYVHTFTTVWAIKSTLESIFSATRRSRCHGSHWVTHFTDVTLVSEDWGYLLATLLMWLWRVRVLTKKTKKAKKMKNMKRLHFWWKSYVVILMLSSDKVSDRSLSSDVSYLVKIVI